MHSETSAAPDGETRPESHGVQRSPPVKFLYVPATQGEQEEPELVNPGAQLHEDAVVAASEAVVLPTGQAVHPKKPTVSL